MNLDLARARYHALNAMQDLGRHAGHRHDLSRWQHSHVFDSGNRRGESRTRWVLVLTLVTMVGRDRRRLVDRLDGAARRRLAHGYACARARRRGARLCTGATPQR